MNYEYNFMTYIIYMYTITKGQFEHELKNGYGEYRFADGNVYVGNFKVC